LAFIGAKPGMKILDIFAVYGWKAELLARAVAPSGTVYAQNSEGAFARIKDALEARLKTPAGANIVSVVRPFEDPAPPGMHDFDRVTFFYAYHDITYLGVDRAKMNKAFYDALKPGGELILGDYSAKPGAGTSVVQTLHRSDEALVTSEIEAAGFKLVEHGDFLRVAADARDTHSHSSAQPVDIYVLRFRKPN
jgi:predicted methyltransferase